MDLEAAKQAVGERAARLVEEGMRLGLGSGSTARCFIDAVGRLAAAGMRLEGVATSRASEEQARALGIAVVELDERGVDLAVDGADAIDGDLRLIKGAGGALLREKVVAAAARRFVVVADETKLVAHLCGRLPVEVVSFGWRSTLAAVAGVTGGAPALRRDAAGSPSLSDNGNLLADCQVAELADPEGLAERLEAIPGVVGHGLFLGMADLVLVAGVSGGVRELRAAS